MAPTIGDVVRNLRGRRFTQREIEERSGGKISQSWLASLETNRSKNPRQRDKLEELARILGTTVTDIYRQAGLVEFADASGLTKDEKELLDLYRSMPAHDRDRSKRMLRELATEYTTSPAGGPQKGVKQGKEG